MWSVPLIVVQVVAVEVWCQHLHNVVVGWPWDDRSPGCECCHLLCVAVVLKLKVVAAVSQVVVHKVTLNRKVHQGPVTCLIFQKWRFEGTISLFSTCKHYLLQSFVFVGWGPSVSSRCVDVVCACATEVMNNERAALFHIPNRNLGGIRERPCRAK